MAMANTFQFNYKVSRRLRVEYIYDLNNINLSIKHMDLFRSPCAGCICRNIFIQTFALVSPFFNHLKICMNLFRATDEVANIWTIDTYLLGHLRTAMSLNFCFDFVVALNIFFFTRQSKRQSKKTVDDGSKKWFN